jgi:hypothetical protein
MALFSLRYDALPEAAINSSIMRARLATLPGT